MEMSTFSTSIFNETSFNIATNQKFVDRSLNIFKILLSKKGLIKLRICDKLTRDSISLIMKYYSYLNK